MLFLRARASKVLSNQRYIRPRQTKNHHYLR